MKIGIIAAMEQEIKPLINHLLSKVIYWNEAECKFYQGQLYNSTILLVISGIGKVSAAIGTTILLDHFKPELIINVGLSGSLINSIKIGDIIVSHNVSYYDVDMTAFNYSLGQMAHCPTVFNTKLFIIRLLKKAIKNIGMHVTYGLILSGDKFINKFQDISLIKNIFPQAIALDMESAAVAHVCYKFDVLFVAIRMISDIPKNGHAVLQFKNFPLLKIKKISILIQEIIKLSYKLTSS